MRSAGPFSVSAVCVFVLSALLSGAALPDVRDFPDVDSCLSRLDPELDIGYDRLAARCPELMKQLEHGTWVPWLPRESERRIRTNSR